MNATMIRRRRRRAKRPAPRLRKMPIGDLAAIFASHELSVSPPRRHKLFLGAELPWAFIDAATLDAAARAP